MCREWRRWDTLRPQAAARGMPHMDSGSPGRTAATTIQMLICRGVFCGDTSGTGVKLRPLSRARPGRHIANIDLVGIGDRHLARLRQDMDFQRAEPAAGLSLIGSLPPRATHRHFAASSRASFSRHTGHRTHLATPAVNGHVETNIHHHQAVHAATPLHRSRTCQESLS